jgi:O-antigen/teichoic acid export membrane protein
LSDTDIGIYNVVGASTAMLAMLGSSLTVSAVRHLAHALGSGDHDEFHIVFNTTLGLFLAIGAALMVIGECLTPVLGWLTIPPDRADAAFWVYQATLAMVLATMLTAPCLAAITAHQALVLESLLAIPGVVLCCLAVCALFFVQGDRLLAFAGFMLLARVCHLLLIAVCCYIRFPDTRPRSSRFHLRLASCRR